MNYNVDLGSYIDQNNLYTFPSDGYVTVASKSGAVGEITIISKNNVPIVALSNASFKDFVTSNSMFVKKGMKCYCSVMNGTYNTEIWISFRHFS